MAPMQECKKVGLTVTARGDQLAVDGLNENIPWASLTPSHPGAICLWCPGVENQPSRDAKKEIQRDEGDHVTYVQMHDDVDSHVRYADTPCAE
jgi:hypothetical protein